MSEPPPMPVIPTSRPVMRPAMMRRGSFTASVPARTSHVARRMTFCATLPSTRRSKKPFLRMPTTMMSAPRSWASATIASAGCPDAWTSSTSRPRSVRYVRAWSRRSRP